MKYCPECGKPMKNNSWKDEYWGSVITIEDYECTNTDCPNCPDYEEPEEEVEEE